eukprot:15359638-Ditylum_brightwellii.AAC.1
MKETPPGVGIIGIDNIGNLLGIGIKGFAITDCKETSHKIILEIVLYVPEAPKNLITVTKWTEDRKENNGILTRRTYSISMCERDKFQKLAPHSVQCRIPMLQTNEGDAGAYQRFYDQHKTCSHNQACLLSTMTHHTHSYWRINR